MFALFKIITTISMKFVDCIYNAKSYLLFDILKIAPY